MKSFKARYTEFLFLAVNRAPFLFSRYLQQTAIDYTSQEHIALEQSQLAHDHTITASIIYGKAQWKAVSVVTKVSRDELNLIRKWMGRQKNSPGNFSNSKSTHSDSTDLHRTSTCNLGMISFGEPTLFSISRIKLKQQSLMHCFISSIELEKGLTYLSLYISLKPDINAKVFNVDITDVKPYYCLKSINPFSPEFRVIEHHSRGENIDNLIVKNTNKILNDAKTAAKVLLKIWKISTQDKNLITVADFFTDADKPYFHDHGQLPGTPENPSKYIKIDDTHRILIDPRTGYFFDSKISPDNTEVFGEDYSSQNFDFDAFFIKSENIAITGTDNSSLNRSLSISDSYIYFSLLTEINTEYKKCMAKVSPLFFKTIGSTKKTLRLLLEATRTINTLEESTSTIKNAVNWCCNPKYRNSLSRRANWLDEKISDLRNSVEQRKELNNSEVQLANLNWGKNYSILVGFLIITQIALALLTVDWTEEGKRHNPIYQNLFHKKVLPKTQQKLTSTKASTESAISEQSPPLQPPATAPTPALSEQNH